MSGEQGYVASQDINVASSSLVASATAPPPSTSLSSIPHLNINDPRLIAPPEPLPLDLPEPTPIPGNEFAPAP